MALTLYHQNHQNVCLNVDYWAVPPEFPIRRVVAGGAWESAFVHVPGCQGDLFVEGLNYVI